MLKLCEMAAIACGGLLMALTSSGVGGQDKQPEAGKAGAEHEILNRFVGEWDCEMEAFLEPGKPPVKSKSSMTGQMIGSFWAVVVVKGEFMGLPYHGQGTFGYDSQRKKKYIGTWADSMSEWLWHYAGSADGNKLALDSQSPSPADPGKLIKSRDTWEFKGKDQILLTSDVEGSDGKMVTMMKATCTRKK